MNSINYINGQWKTDLESTIPIQDTGFLLGDGLFETIRFDNKNLFNPKKHLTRLFKGLNVIRINLEDSEKKIILLLEEIISKNKFKSGLLRLMITRGIATGPPWQYQGPPGIYITIRPITKITTQKVKVVFYSETKYPIIRFNPAIKSLNYIGNMLAKKDADKDQAYEPIFYNKAGFITECAIRNIFFIKDNTLLAPTTDLGVLPGVMRSTIIQIAEKMNLKIEEGFIPYKNINNMDEAFISSTGIGLLPCFWDGWKSNYYLTKQIQNELNTIIYNY